MLALREFAETLLLYRAEHKLSQRVLAEKLGASQPRVIKLESGEHDPEVDTIINAVRNLGIEFALDVAPASRKSGACDGTSSEARGDRP
jgi:transcriptional regulator with XRE-family HTH domain